MEQIKNKNRSFLLFFIIFLTSFLLGFYTSNNYGYLFGEFTKKDNGIIQSIVNTKTSTGDLDLDLFWKVYNIVSQNYYGNDDLKPKDLQYGVITGFINSLGDKFSEFMTPDITKQFEDVLSGDFEGIGAVIDKNELGILVDRVLKGSPALNSGIRQGDIIIEANGVSLKDLTLQEGVNNIKGPAGTKVVLKILRAGENDFIIKEVIRDKIKIPSVDTKDINNQEIGYISINLFGENTSKEFAEILNTFNNEKIKGIIIDLRDNGGGYLQSAVEILSNFIEKGKLLVTTKYKNSLLNNYYYSENFGEVFDKKIVVLINGNSASASEITAGALKDYNKAILVGEKSYGKGSVQQPFDLPDGSMLKLTIAKWYTPKDYSIDHNGIIPDIKVEFKKEDYTPIPGKEKDFKPYDRQLEEAVKILKKFIKFGNISLTIDEYNKENLKTGSGELVGSGSKK
ncbi:MAG: S41 family peptidase [Candidatus Gracilibacteria bacterium]|nr:S41 family peptidase [Candidatus Gracilibacteria bacterium]